MARLWPVAIGIRLSAGIRSFLFVTASRPAPGPIHPASSPAGTGVQWPVRDMDQSVLEVKDA